MSNSINIGFSTTFQWVGGQNYVTHIAVCLLIVGNVYILTRPSIDSSILSL